MSDEPRVLQAADVYNATHDLPLYEWVASLESQNEALQREVKNKAAILNAIEALLDVDDEHTGWDRIVALQEALHGLLHALGAHAVTLGAVIDHMTQHECFCQQADALYRADAESGDALHAAVDRAKAALSPTQETDLG